MEVPLPKDGFYMIRWTKESISYDTDPLASEYEHIIYILAWEETAKEEGALNKLHTSAPPPPFAPNAR